MNRFLLLIALALGCPTCAFFAGGLCAAQTPQPTTPKPEILILGSYHMANPGHDIYNLMVDDVTSPRRQKELAQVIEVLKRFHPTKIAIESDVTNSPRQQKYADYLAGKYTLTPNEIDQIGFRLAKELGHTKIYPVDVDGDFPIMRVQNWAKANGHADKLAALDAASKKQVKEENDFILSHTVLENLLRVNSDAQVAQGYNWYYQIERLGEPWEYAGPDLLASWFQRNIRIYHNIANLIDGPQERVLVIYGYGHLGWLRQITASDPAVRLRKLDEFAK
jgi:hypothetical protein